MPIFVSVGLRIPRGKPCFGRLPASFPGLVDVPLCHRHDPVCMAQAEHACFPVASAAAAPATADGVGSQVADWSLSSDVLGEGLFVPWEGLLESCCHLPWFPLGQGEA